jgi:DNA-binding NarL/FixJ family response regulator
MSNAKRFPDRDCAPSSQSLSRTPTVSDGGATMTPFDSSSRSCTPNSGAKATSCGNSAGHPPNPEATSLAQRVAAPDYLARVGLIAEQIATTTEQSGVLALLRAGADALGAEQAIFVSFVRDSTDVSVCRFMLACDPGWCRAYLDAGCITQDPWLAYAIHHAEPVVASALMATRPEQQRAIQLAIRNGFASTVLVPAHSGPGHSRISLLCLGSATPGFFDANGFGRFKIGARVLACELHDWWLARIRRELVVKARITASDLELLRHERLGHGSKRIAAELQVSKSSINSRFQRMNVKLGVANRKLAAQLASDCGLIPE